MSLKQEYIVYLLGTIFSCRLIHIWCSSEYLQQQDSVCEKTTVPMFMVVNELVSHCNNVPH